MAIALNFALNGCSSGHHAQLTQSTPTAKKAADSNYVEAYFEYLGPAARWAGPPTLTLHVTTPQAGNAKGTAAKVTYSGPSVGAVSVRKPAQERISSEISLGAAREELANIASSLRDDQSNFAGCLAPVRIRLLRADGGVFEKTVCRNQEGFPIALSTPLGQFMKTAFSNEAPRSTELSSREKSVK